MDAGIVRALDARFLFVVGKGGVGKTTTAGMFGVLAADAGQTTHLVSMDPAHSLGDLFGRHLASGRPERCACQAGLLLEEFDAASYARAWLASVAEPLAQLMEAGTYLAADEVRSLLELPLPGEAELMGALRLVDLDAHGVDRIIVDTAPTGHALRLLDSGDTLRGWIAALRAMASKANAVATGLLGRPYRHPAERLIDDLEARIQTFHDRVLRHARAVVVGTTEKVVQAETRRLARAMDARGLDVALLVLTGQAGEGFRAVPDSPPILVLPRRRPEGCEGLRALAVDAVPLPAGPAGNERGTRMVSGRPHTLRVVEGRRGARGSGSDAVLELLGRRELVLFAGKGGVGKSTCAAATALGLAEDHEVTLAGLDPAGSLSDVLGIPVPPEGAGLSPGLDVRQVDATVELARFRDAHFGDAARVLDALAGRVGAELDRQVLEAVWAAVPPGVDEIVALAALVESRRHGGTQVADAAPTGHFLRLLAMPELALGWTRALLRVLARYRGAFELDESIEDALAFAKRLKALKAALADPDRTAVVIVTLPEPLVSAETLRLQAAVQAAGLSISAVIHNRCAVPPPEDADAPVLLAPELHEPPVGHEALRRFYDTWTRVA